MKRLTGIWRSALVLTLSVALVIVLFFCGILAFTASQFLLEDEGADFSTTQVAGALTVADGHYTLAPEMRERLAADHRWAMLIADDGHVVWSQDKPDDVPDHYSLRDVASFTRWYLEDYPVHTRIRDDGLLVVGAPKGSVWRHDISFTTTALSALPFFAAATFLAMLVCVLGISALLLRRWFRKDQARVDAARAEWVNGVSHDIRTPLALVMGTAAQMEADPSLSDGTHKDAALIRRQSQTIRDLVGDLNLTMRLSSSMQPLRRETVQPAALLRQAVADLLNSGQADGYPIDIDLPETPLPTLDADPGLLRRALTNLLNNCVRHNPPGCTIRAGAFAADRHVVLFVESDAPAASATIGQAPGVAADGLAAHGTGLALVQKIAQAHGGQARFDTDGPFRCELWLPRR